MTTCRDLPAAGTSPECIRQQREREEANDRVGVTPVDQHYVPAPNAILTALQVAEWLQLRSRSGALQPRLVQRLGIPAIRLGHKTLRYQAATVAKWLEKQAKAA